MDNDEYDRWKWEVMIMMKLIGDYSYMRMIDDDDNDWWWRQWLLMTTMIDDDDDEDDDKWCDDYGRIIDDDFDENVW